MKTFKPSLKTRIASGLGLMAVAGVSSAALPEAVSTAFSTATSDAVTAGGLALAAIVAAVAFKYIRRAL